MTKGKFIVFEGLDGSGKTTQLEMLYKKIKSICKERECITTKEPSDDMLGRLCREIGSGKISMLPETAALLYAADRIEHIDKVLLPKLESGCHIICDRYYLSNIAYQSVKTDFYNILSYNKAAMEKLRPDITIYVDVPPEACQKRRTSRGTTTDIYETLDYAKKIHKQYLLAIDRLKETENILIINGDRSPDEVAADIWSRLESEFFTKEDLF